MPADGPFYLQNVRLVLISFPQLQVGSTVEVDTETRRNAPPMDHTFSLLETLQGDQPVLRQDLTVTLPASMPLAWKVYRGEADVHPAGAGRPGHLPLAGGRAAADGAGALHAAGPGSDAGAGHFHHPASWKDVSRWFANLSRDGQKMTPDLDPPGGPGHRRQDHPGGQDPGPVLLGRPATSATWRPPSPARRPASSRPPAEQTYQRKYGVCRDKAQFLVTLLRSIGVDAYNVLHHRRGAPGRGHPRHPVQPRHRRHPPGRRQLQLPGPHRRGFPPVPALLGPVQVRPGVHPRRARTSSPRPWRRPATTAWTSPWTPPWGPTAPWRTRVVMEPSGIYDLVFRQYLNSLPPARREMFFTSMAGRIFPGATLSGPGPAGPGRPEPSGAHVLQPVRPGPGHPGRRLPGLHHPRPGRAAGPAAGLAAVRGHGGPAPLPAGTVRHGGIPDPGNHPAALRVQGPLPALRRWT